MWLQGRGTLHVLIPASAFRTNLAFHDVMHSGFNNQGCSGGHHLANNTTAADPDKLKACWLRQALHGGCMEYEHTDCHAYGFDSTNVQRVEVSIPGWRGGHESSVWVSEDLLAAVGWREHCKPHQWPQGFDPRNISALRRMAGHLRVCAASRAKLSLLGICNTMSLSPDMTERCCLRRAGVSGVLLTIIDAGPAGEDDEKTSDQSDDDADLSETDVRYRCELTSLAWVLSLATAGNLLAVKSEQTPGYARSLTKMLRTFAVLPDLDDSERFTIAAVYTSACKTLGDAPDVRGLFPAKKTSSSRAELHTDTHEDNNAPCMEGRSSDVESDSGRNLTGVANSKGQTAAQGAAEHPARCIQQQRAQAEQGPDAQQQRAAPKQGTATPQQSRATPQQGDAFTALMMDPSAAHAPETRPVWKEALEQTLGRRLDLSFDQDVFSAGWQAGLLDELSKMSSEEARCMQAGIMAGRANRARREAAAAERSACSGTLTSLAAEEAAVPPSSTAIVRSPARDQSPSSTSASSGGSARGGNRDGGSGGGRSGFSYGAALGVRSKQDAVQAAVAAGGQRAADPSSSNVTAGLGWVQQPLSRSSSSGVSSEGQQAGQAGVSDSDSSGAGPGSSRSGSSSSSGGTDSFAQPAVVLPPSAPLAAVQSMRGDWSDRGDQSSTDEDPFAWLGSSHSEPLAPPGPPPAPLPAPQQQAPQPSAATLQQQRQEQRQQELLAAARAAAADPSRPPPHSSTQAMIRAAAAANQTYKPQRAAAKPKPPGSRNMFQLLDDDVYDAERYAAEGTGASASSQDPTGEAALQRSASVGRVPPAAAAAIPAAAAVASTATRPPVYLPPQHPPVQTTLATPQHPEQQQTPPQLPPPQPSLEVQTPLPAPAPVEPAAPRPTSAPAVLLGDGAADNFECPLTMDIMEDPVVCSDGFTYEREAIEEWMTKSNSSPMTGLALASKALTPNQALRGAIRAMMARRG